MIEVVLNQLSADGMKLVRVISDQRVSEAFLWSLVPGAAREFAVVKPWETAALSLFYGEVKFPVRGVVEVAFSGQQSAVSRRRVRKFATWRLMESEGYRVSEIICFLAEWYFAQTKRRAGYAFVRSLPKGAERFMEVDGLMLLDVEWCLEKCVMVGG